MWVPLLLAALDTAETAKGLDEKPWPFFLALVIGAAAALWGALVSVAWWGAKGQLKLQADQIVDLKHERDEAQKEAREERAARLGLAVDIATTAKGLARIREDLDDAALKKRTGTRPPHAAGGSG